MDLNTFETYIETNLANGFIQPSKFFAKARKSLMETFAYTSTTKVQITWPSKIGIPLIDELLNRLSYAKQLI